jgi:signal transduction histidine kinase
MNSGMTTSAPIPDRNEILLIEDEVAHAFLIQNALNALPYSINHLTSIGEAQRYLIKDTPLLILSDLNLSDAKGVETVRQIHKFCPKVPIIVLTASTLLKDAVEAMRAGAEDFVVKSFDDNFADVLKMSILRCLERLETLRITAQLEHERECLQQAINYGHDGLAVIGEAGKCNYTNSSFREFTERTGLNAQNLLVLEGLNVKNRNYIAQKIKSALVENTKSGVIKIELEPLNGQDEAYELSLSAIGLPQKDERVFLDENDSILRIAWVRDISELKQRERFQRETLSATTHDLKGPLGAISLSVELLQRITDPVKNSEIIVRIGALAKTCQNLIDEFLSASSIKAGTLIVKRELTDVVALINEAIAGNLPLADNRKIALLLDNSITDCHWLLDRLAFLRILNNLISNGIKYTDSGGKVTISIAVITDNDSDNDNEQNQLLQVKIADTGKGVSPSRITKIFEPYARLARDSKNEGHGLGLFVTKSLVSAHSGTITVESIIGFGSTFIVSIPQHSSASKIKRV